MRRTPRLVAPTLLAALVLTGCFPTDPAPTPPPTPDATPVFASEEEALAAAEEVYRAFLSATDAVLSSGGEHSGELAGLATEEVIAQEEEAFRMFRENGWRLTGASNPTVTLQSFDDEAVVIYSCDDISGTDVLDATGASVVDMSRPDQIPLEITLRLEGNALLVADRSRWDGGGVCSSN